MCLADQRVAGGGSKAQPGESSHDTMKENEKYHVTSDEEKGIHIINIKAIEDIGYIQPDTLVSGTRSAAPYVTYVTATTVSAAG